MWFILRILVVTGVAVEIASLSPATSNLDWIACGLISSATGVGLFLWLRSIRYRADIDWTQPFSVMRPFFPMNRNPVRFWLLTAVSLLLGGLTAFLRELISGKQHAAFGATFIFMGIAIFLALAATRKLGAD